MLFVAANEAVAGINNDRAPNRHRKPAESGEPVEHHMRLTPEQIIIVADEFHERRMVTSPRASYMSSVRRTEIFLAYMASGEYYEQLAKAAGVATSTALLYTHEVADFLYETAAGYISFPRPEEFANLSSPLQDENGRNLRIILYIDGEIVRIQRPDHAGDACYCGRSGKNCDSMNVQYVTDCRGQVRHVISGLPGATHRTAVEWDDEFHNFLDTLPEYVAVLGDPVYRNLHPRIVTSAVGRNLNPEQLRFNQACTLLRQIVERTIGATELKWRMSQMKENRFPAKKGVLFAAKCMVGMCQLHNRFTNFL